MPAVSTAQDIVALMGAPSADDKALVEKAYAFAAEAHKDHKRLSGEPYLIHLAETAGELAKLGMGAKTVAAGLLHDMVEDVGVEPETIEKEFGKEVRFLVDGVTKLGRLKYRGAERHRESLRKLLVATGKDARVLIIKLMDRLHNMRTLQYVPAEKRERIALETLEIYAAIAHRLGMGVVRRRLEKMSRMLSKEIAKENMKGFHSDYRVNGLYSLWRKLKRKEGDVDKIYDIAALRIIVKDIPDCYRVLGIVNNLWQPLPGKIKDYIAFPKPNGYQSLHTTVFSGDGGIVEIQIRTKEMHREAEYGITAHVLYKESSATKPAEGSGRSTSFDWIKSLIPRLRRGSAPQTQYAPPEAPEWLSMLEAEEDDPDFEMTLKTDIFTMRVFVFTPTGDVVDLPVNSSPIDFAYAIHSDIGDHVAGAKKNDKLMPLDSILENGDIVEILTKKAATPTQKWLDFAKTTLARRHIRLALEREEAKKSPRLKKN